MAIAEEKGQGKSRVDSVTADQAVMGELECQDTVAKWKLTTKSCCVDMSTIGTEGHPQYAAALIENTGGASWLIGVGRCRGWQSKYKGKFTD